jgi:hypothetical protein
MVQRIELLVGVLLPLPTPGLREISMGETIAA